MNTALPPHVHHSTSPISPLSGLNALTTFLDSANNTPAYRPDSTLTERGPISSSTSNLTLHHLNRIKLGLEGTRIGAAEIKAEDASLAPLEEAESRKRKRELPKTPRVERIVGQDFMPLVRVTSENDEPAVKTTEDTGGEWEDKDNYELAQDDEQVDMNTQRDPADGIEQPANSQEAADVMEVEETQSRREVPLPLQESQETLEKRVVDKEERKRLKRLRQEQGKKEGNGRARKEKKQKTKS
jgi:hypothetical protein